MSSLIRLHQPSSPFVGVVQKQFTASPAIISRRCALWSAPIAKLWSRSSSSQCALSFTCTSAIGRLCVLCFNLACTLHRVTVATSCTLHVVYVARHYAQSAQCDGDSCWIPRVQSHTEAPAACLPGIDYANLNVLDNPVTLQWLHTSMTCLMHADLELR